MQFVLVSKNKSLHKNANQRKNLSSNINGYCMNGHIFFLLLDINTYHSGKTNSYEDLELYSAADAERKENILSVFDDRKNVLILKPQ